MIGMQAKQVLQHKFHSRKLTEKMVIIGAIFDMVIIN